MVRIFDDKKYNIYNKYLRSYMRENKRDNEIDIQT